jgi:hypothetical protein
MSLPEALRALPQQAPAQSVWPQLAAQLAAQGRARAQPAARLSTRRWRVPAALAAGVLLVAIAWPLRQHKTPGPAVADATVSLPAASISTNAANSANATSKQSTDRSADAATRLASLQDRSQALEHWLRETQRAAAPLSGQDLAAAAEIEDMIALVDGQLGAAPRDSEVRLWQRRVALLEDLTALRYSSYKLAEKTGVALR